MSLLSFLGLGLSAPATATVAPAAPTVTMPVAVSNAVIPATVNNGLGFLAVLSTYLTSQGIDVTSIMNTVSNQQFWTGLAAVGATLAINHVVTSNANKATVAAWRMLFIPPRKR